LEIIPSIDLLKGKVVRLIKGDPNFSKIYSDDPVATSIKWMNLGAKTLHVVDLDAALSSGSNLAIVKKIVNAVKIPIQLGGGLRSVEKIREVLGLGVDRAVVGTMAFLNSNSISELVLKYGSERIVVALDYRLNHVMVSGWRCEVDMTVGEALKYFKDLGVKRFLLTCIERDGTLKGPDLETLYSASSLEGVEIFASGGVSSLRDLHMLKEVGVEGVIVGRALYEGCFTLEEALAAGGG